MYDNHILIRPDAGSQTATLNQFLEAPQEILQAAGDRIWLGSEETFEQIPHISELLSPQPAIVQFHSDPIVQELLDVASDTVNGCLGITGLTSVGKSLIEETLSSRAFDVTRAAPALSVELFAGLVDRCDLREVCSAPDTSFRSCSTLPLSQSSSDGILLRAIRSLSDDQLTNGNPGGTAAVEIRAGLLLIHDYLEPSHQCSQSIEGEGIDVNGDYWHGIMHRREPDFGNSKYWFRRVGQHPCFEKLADTARQLAGQFDDPGVAEWTGKLTRTGWDSIAAVEFFQEAHGPRYKGTVFQQFASCLQMQEMLILLTHCCRSCEGT